MNATAPRFVSRIAAAVLGGYGFVWGLTVLGIMLGMSLGMSYGDSQTTMFLAAFPVFLTLFLWAFTVRSLARVWLVLAGGGALMTGTAWLLQGSPA